MEAMNQIHTSIIETIKKYETLDTSDKLQNAEIHQKIIEEIKEKTIQKSRFA